MVVCFFGVYTSCTFFAGRGAKKDPQTGCKRFVLTETEEDRSPKTKASGSTMESLELLEVFFFF